VGSTITMNMITTVLHHFFLLLTNGFEPHVLTASDLIVSIKPVKKKRHTGYSGIVFTHSP